MKRKTNLFYNTGPDSNFLTFSNYTEALTGNFLSTNTKLFPSGFLCLYVSKLNGNNLDDEGFENTKSELIKNYLVSYYENKLTELRDYNSNNPKNKKDILPLHYLLDTIYKYDNKFNLSYIGNITEQSYENPYTDTILLIDTNNTLYNYSCIFYSDFMVQDYIDAEDKLHGWYIKDTKNEVYIGPSDYNNVNPLYDNPTKYNSLSLINNIVIRTTDEQPIIETNKIMFNVIIPLFDFVNTDIRQPLNNIESNNLLTNASETKNVPLGIWFSRRPIVLYKDKNYGQSWSLAIGSQFKPFPTSNNIPSDIEQNSTTQAFNTFAKILCKQNEITDLLTKYSEMITNLSQRIDNIVIVNNDKTDIGIPYNKINNISYDKQRNK